MAAETYPPRLLLQNVIKPLANAETDEDYAFYAARFKTHAKISAELPGLLGVNALPVCVDMLVGNALFSAPGDRHILKGLLAMCRDEEHGAMVIRHFPVKTFRILRDKLEAHPEVAACAMRLLQCLVRVSEGRWVWLGVFRKTPAMEASLKPLATSEDDEQAELARELLATLKPMVKAAKAE